MIISRLCMVLSIIFLIALIVLMVIPIRNATINNTFIVGFRLDYIIHSLIYLPWMIVGKAMFEKFNPFLWLIVGVLLVVLLEVIQFIIPYRNYNMTDLVAGVIGVTISYLIFKLIKCTRCQKTE